MPLEFSNVIKALTTQSLLATLLERGGYRVTRLGIEELFGEVKHLEQQQYLALNLPEALRFLPDLLVADRDMTEAFLVEVKYRRRFDDESRRSLYEELNKQRSYWPQSHAVLMIGEPFVENGRFHQDYMRVIPSNEQHRLIDDLYKAHGVDMEYTPELRWNNLPMLLHTFRSFNQSGELNRYERYVSRVVASLAKL